MALAVMVCAVLATAVGCGADKGKPLPSEKRLYEFYPGDISRADAIEIRSGSTGELRRFENEEVVADWIADVRDIVMVPDQNQEGRVGFLYGVTLFDGEDQRLGFTPNSFPDGYYLYNEKLEGKIRDLFDGIAEE